MKNEIDCSIYNKMVPLLLKTLLSVKELCVEYVNINELNLSLLSTYL